MAGIDPRQELLEKIRDELRETGGIDIRDSRRLTDLLNDEDMDWFRREQGRCQCSMLALIQRGQWKLHGEVA